MAAFLLDTSCIIAAVCGWHEQHERTEAEIARRLRQRERLLVAGAALVEAYSVLTRLPAPYRLSPVDALALLDRNFMCRIVALDAARYGALLRRAPADGIAGGAVYDAVIAECAVKAKARTLLTFNASHFAAFTTLGLDIVVPGTA